MDAGVTLRAARQRAGMSQTDLAREAGTSQATISAYESGRKEPTVSTFSRLLAATGSQLAIRPTKSTVIEPSARQLRQAGRTLADVIALAAELPTRHDPALRYPRLPSPPAHAA